MGDGFVRPGVNGNFHHKKDYHDFDRKICRAKNATGCKFPGNWVQDNNYCHIVTGRGVQKVYDDFDVLYNPRGSLISEGISTLVSSSNKCMKLELSKEDFRMEGTLDFDSLDIGIQNGS